MIIFYTILAISLCILTFIYYKKFYKNKLKKEIKALESLKRELENEIELIKNTINKTDSNYFKFIDINNKIDKIIDKSNEHKPTNTIELGILIIIATALILYFMHKLTYYIQPNNQIETLNNLLNKLRL